VLVLGNRLASAEKCVELGAFDEAVGAHRVLPRALEMAQDLAALPADTYAQTKHELRREALEVFRTAAEVDPLLDRWVSPV
jgi:hypothetical protein